MTEIRYEDGVSFVRRTEPIVRGTARRRQEAERKARAKKLGKIQGRTFASRVEARTSAIAKGESPKR